MLRGFSLLMVLAEKRVIAIVITLHRRGVSAQRTFNDGIYEKSRDDGPVRVAGDHVRGDDLFGYHDHALGRLDGLEHHAETSPGMRIAVGIRAGNMDDGYIRIERVDREKLFRWIEGR